MSQICLDVWNTFGVRDAARCGQPPPQATGDTPIPPTSAPPTPSSSSHSAIRPPFSSSPVIFAFNLYEEKTKSTQTSYKSSPNAARKRSLLPVAAIIADLRGCAASGYYCQDRED